MSAVIAVPTVEHINLEHQLATSKAVEAVQHATTCGLLLLQVKASLSHGEWLPWLNGEIDSGRLQVGTRQVQKYMRLGSNTNRSSYLLEAPSIHAALELLSDREPAAEQAPLLMADLEAERQARIAAEQQAETERAAREIAERRNAEWAAQSNGQRQHINTLEQRIDRFEATPAPVERIEVIQPDYEALKAKAAQLETELAQTKAEQTRIIQSAIKAKLQGYQGEVDDLERRKTQIETVIAAKKAYLDALDSDVRRIETHHSVINGVRLELIGLAAFLNDLEPITDTDTVKRWLALAEMHDAASQSIRLVFEPARPPLTHTQGTPP